jgi:hypothetical protein
MSGRCLLLHTRISAAGVCKLTYTTEVCIIHVVGRAKQRMQLADSTEVTCKEVGKNGGPGPGFGWSF